MKHSKFEFREFGRGKIIYAPKSDFAEVEKNRLIEVAIKEALADNVPITLDEGTVHSMGGTAVEEPPVEPQIDIEAIRAESYQNGYNDAKAHFEPLVQKSKEDEELFIILKERLEAIIPQFDLKSRVFELSATVMSTLGKKLNLALPTDFEKIIMGELMSILNKYYRAGDITIKINPEKVDYCQNLLKIKALPAIIAQNIIFLPEESLSKNDCVLSWNDTEVVYSQEQILQDAENIIEHLKNSINN